MVRIAERKIGGYIYRESIDHPESTNVMAKVDTGPTPGETVQPKKRGRKPSGGPSRGRMVVVISRDYESWLAGFRKATGKDLSDLVREAMNFYAVALRYDPPPKY